MELLSFDFILVTTKNIPDVARQCLMLLSLQSRHAGKDRYCSLAKRIQHRETRRRPLLYQPNHQSVSYCGTTVKSPGNILHDDPDEQKGPFHNPGVPVQVAEDAAKPYLNIYNLHGKLEVVYDDDVRRVRWRKLLYNASFNTVSTILRMDTPRMRQSRHVIDDLIRPIINEILVAAAADGYTGYPDNVAEKVIHQDPLNTAFKPSTCQDIEKGNLIELENIVGEPLREGEAKGVPMQTLRTIYYLLKSLQLKVMRVRDCGSLSLLLIICIRNLNQR